MRKSDRDSREVLDAVNLSFLYEITDPTETLDL